MMTKTQAMEYGKKISCKFYVRNNHGGLYGGFKNEADAIKCKSEAEDEIRTSPFMTDSQKREYKVFIEIK